MRGAQARLVRSGAAHGDTGTGPTSVLRVPRVLDCGVGLLTHALGDVQVAQGNAIVPLSVCPMSMPPILRGA